MLKKHLDEVAAAEIDRRRAQLRLKSASQQWHFQKRFFFTRPVNLLLPFTAGALLASRGSTARQAVDWSRVISTTFKMLISAYPLLAQLSKRKSVPVPAKSRTERRTTHDA